MAEKWGISNSSAINSANSIILPDVNLQINLKSKTIKYLLVANQAQRCRLGCIHLKQLGGLVEVGQGWDAQGEGTEGGQHVLASSSDRERIC